MSSKVVPFGHRNFNLRAKEILKNYNNPKENVAYISAVGANEWICDNVVNGWIGSPGHLRNIIGKNDFSAVAAFYCEERNLYYFTQLFASY